MPRAVSSMPFDLCRIIFKLPNYLKFYYKQYSINMIFKHFVFPKSSEEKQLFNFAPTPSLATPFKKCKFLT